MSTYQTKQNDVLDAICQNRYGHTTHTMQVLEHNRHLVAYPANLPTGVLIDLPDFEKPNTDTINLWDD